MARKSQQTLAAPEKERTLLEVLESAGESDLQEIDDRLHGLRAKMDETLASYRRQIDALELARKLLSVKLHGKPPRKVRQKRAAAAAAGGSESTVVTTGGGGGDQPGDGDGSTLKERIWDLVQTEGAMSIEEIARHFGTSKAAVAMCIARCNWFRREGETVHNA